MKNKIFKLLCGYLAATLMISCFIQPNAMSNQVKAATPITVTGAVESTASDTIFNGKKTFTHKDEYVARAQNNYNDPERIWYYEYYDTSWKLLSNIVQEDNASYTSGNLYSYGANLSEKYLRLAANHACLNNNNATEVKKLSYTFKAPYTGKLKVQVGSTTVESNNAGKVVNIRTYKNDEELSFSLNTTTADKKVIDISTLNNAQEVSVTRGDSIRFTLEVSSSTAQILKNFQPKITYTEVNSFLTKIINGDTVTVVETPTGSNANITPPTQDGQKFLGWFNQYGEKVTIFNAAQTIYAQWSNGYTITVTGGKLEEHTAATSGSFFYNDKVMVSAEQTSNGQTFQGWYVGSELVSTDTNYSFYAFKDMTIEAKYAAPGTTKPVLAKGIYMDDVQLLPNQNGTYSIKFIGHVVIPAGDSVSATGFIYTGKNDSTLPVNEFNATNTDTTKVKKVIIPTANTSKQFSVTVTNIPANKLCKGKFYIKTANGANFEYTYSETKTQSTTIANS